MVAPDGGVEIALDRPPGSAAVAAGHRRSRRRRMTIGLGAVAVLLAAAGAVVAGYVSGVPVPPLAVPDNATTVYYADGSTVLARLADRARIVIDPATLPPHVEAAVLSAQDRDFRDKARWGRPSELARRHARLMAGRTSATRLRVTAAKMEDRYGRDRILGAYLNAVSFGRNTEGVEAGAYAYFGKPAKDLGVAEAIVLAGQIGAPDNGSADPTAHPDAARQRWERIKAGMVDPLRALDAATAARMSYPTTVLGPTEGARRIPAGELAGPNAHIARQVLAELEQVPRLRGKGRKEITGGGYTVVSTIEQSRQRALERQADETVSGSVLNGEPPNLQAAAVAVEPGTGRVVAYYGGHDGTAHDYAGSVPGQAGDTSGRAADTGGRAAGIGGRAAGIGGHPAGMSFAVYVLAAALGAGISVKSRWDTRSPQTFPADGRGPSAPVRNVGGCQPAPPVAGTLAEIVACGLNAPLYAVTSRLGAARVVEMAHAAGIDQIWHDRGGPIDLRAMRAGTEVAPRYLSTEVGIGQYPITVVDHANGMATFAARGERAGAHFVASVSRRGSEIHREDVATRSVGLTPAQVDDLTWALSQNDAGKLPDARPVATVDGSWQFADTKYNAHAWIAGFTPQLGVAVWVGNRGVEQPLRHRTGAPVTGSSLPAQIFSGFLSTALAGTARTDFAAPTFGGDPNAGNVR